MNSKSVIELNGKRYDAVTGVVVTSVAHAPAITAPAAPPKPPVKRTRTIISDVVAVRRHPKSQATLAPASVRLAAKQVKSVTPPKTIGKSTTKSTAVLVNHTVAHKPQAAQTLMRAAVSKPEPGFKKQINVQTSLQHAVPSLIVKKLSASTITPERLERAKTVERSQKITKFDYTNAHHVTPGIAHIPVQAAPDKPASEPVAAPSPQPTNKPLDMFEQALVNATNFVDTKAHRAGFQKKARRHTASLAASTLALFIIGAFAVYQNTPGLQLKFAGMQAGFSTTMPNLKAAGFAYTGVSAHSGKLTLGLSDSNGQKYQLSQTTTNWSSTDMIQSISATDASGYPNYQTVTAGETPIYRFDNTSATWVKNGKWYQVTGTGSLTNDQVKALAQNS